jgi:hypothetical protein
LRGLAKWALALADTAAAFADLLAFDLGGEAFDLGVSVLAAGGDAFDFDFNVLDGDAFVSGASTFGFGDAEFFVATFWLFVDDPDDVFLDFFLGCFTFVFVLLAGFSVSLCSFACTFLLLFLPLEFSGGNNRTPITFSKTEMKLFKILDKAGDD